MSLTLEEQELINSEETELKTVIGELTSLLKAAGKQLGHESAKARDFTSQIMATRRIEDKALLASDEAVAHAMAHKKKDEIKLYEDMLTAPYFARMELEEDGERLDYKLGVHSNPDCRIIDWRASPLSRIFYDYQEGEDYSEEIQGRERNGRISSKRSLEIKQGTLKRISSSTGTFKKAEDGSWTKLSSSGPMKRKDGNLLPHILSVITPAQYKLISSPKDQTLLIQGVAGSGKTSVALHRLAWLLHEKNSDVQVNECSVVVRTPLMKTYVAEVLPSVGVSNVRISGLQEFLEINLGGNIQRPKDFPSSSIDRVYRSLAFLKLVENSPSTELAQHLASKESFLKIDETKLLSAELITAARERLTSNNSNQVYDYALDALRLRQSQLLGRLPNGNLPLQYLHLVVDEIQDLSATELAAIFGAISSKGSATMIGDKDQESEGRGFVGWEKLRSYWAERGIESHHVSLDVSFRSTLPIMRLASYVSRREAPSAGRDGRVPIVFKTKNRDNALEAATNWINLAMQKYPEALTCVLCKTKDEARFLHSLLQPSFGNQLLQDKSGSFLFANGLVVLSLAEAKGLEFVNVLIWDVSERNFNRNEDTNRNNLYIAQTRAIENLAMISIGNISSLLPPTPNAFLRIHEVDE